MISGTVKWFDENKGFGFITAEGGKDVFVHHTALQGPGRPKLYDGQRVEFEIVEGAKGPRAENLTPVD